MKNKKLILTLSVLTLTVTACNQSTPEPPVTADSGNVPGVSTPEPDINILVVADGDMSLKRDGWSDFHPTTFGVELHKGDQLQTASEATVTVLCHDLSTYPVPAGERVGVNNGCPFPSPPNPILKSPIGKAFGTRGVSDPLIPYVISPRRTQLLDNQPLLRWNEIPGVSAYTVRISDADTGDVIWQTTAAASGVAYPGDPPLELGVAYLLVVEADNGTSSSSEGVAGLGFRLLEDRDAQAMIRSEAGRLSEIGLAGEAETFALAYLYAGNGLIAEAIETLEALADGGSQQAAIYRLLGGLYRLIELNLEAERSYQTAVELAQGTGDVEGLAAAQAALGEVNAALGRNDEAIRLLREALDGYEILGDGVRAVEISKLLAGLDG